MKKISDVEIIAHRGGQGPHVENTLESFQYALKLGFKALEFDVRYAYFSKVFFLEHDFLHHPRYRNNTVDKIFPKIPEKISLFLEIKTNSIFTNVFAKACIKLHKKFLKNRRSFIISFNPIVLYRIKKLNPEIQVGFICGNRFFKYLFEMVILHFLKPEVYIVNRRLLKRRTVRFAKKHGMKTYSYVINRNIDRHKALDLDIDGIITDYPL